MRKIQFGKPMLSSRERDAVQKVLQGDILVHGPVAKQFEADFAQFTGAKYAVTTSSCTASLHLTHFDRGLGKGDEVIVPAMTHVATAHSVELCGATPVFVDAEIRTGNIDLAKIEEKITPKTKAISLVHFLGMPVAMDEINRIARKHSLYVVEDAALGVCSYYKGKHAGSMGDTGCFSFYPVKHITTAEGGMITTNDEETYKRLLRKRAFGVDRTVAERTVPGFYDVTMLGFNYRMNEIAAALGIEQLKSAAEFHRIRETNYRLLNQGFREIPEVDLFESSNGDFVSSYYCFSALLGPKVVSKRLEIVRRLNELGVGTSIYYPQPVPAFTYYQEKYGEKVADRYPVASRIANSSISLPVGPHLGAEDMSYIVSSFKTALAGLA